MINFLESFHEFDFVGARVCDSQQHRKSIMSSYPKVIVRNPLLQVTDLRSVRTSGFTVNDRATGSTLHSQVRVLQ